MKIKHVILYFVVGSIVLCSTFAAQAYSVQQNDADDQSESAQYAKQLSSPDPATRQAAAEALARLVALNQKKLVEGYVLQEKDKRVRLALQWALYRMGKSTALFQIVRDLDSSRQDQAINYLSQIESGEPLYVFLREENTRPKVIVAVIDVLGRIGDAETLQQIKPFVDSPDPKVSEAAQLSTNMINHRLGEAQPGTKTRPRTIVKTDQP
jgi:HEAT repeat protein